MLDLQLRMLAFGSALLLWQLAIISACSSRSISKPRPEPVETTTALPTTTTPRPNITFPIFNCPPTYAAWYCLNDATCFTVEIHNQVLYNCECAIGYMGPRCEYKEIDGSYLPTRQRVLLEKASIVSGATLALLLMLLFCWMLYMRRERQEKEKMLESAVSVHEHECIDQVDGICGSSNVVRMQPLRPFGMHHYKIMPITSSAAFRR